MSTLLMLRFWAVIFSPLFLPPWWMCLEDLQQCYSHTLPKCWLSLTLTSHSILSKTFCPGVLGEWHVIGMLFLSMGFARLKAVRLPICNFGAPITGWSTILRCSGCALLPSNSWVGFFPPICSFHWRRWWVRVLTPHICSPSSLL